MKDTKKLITNLAVYSSGRFLTKFSAFLLIPIYSIYLTTADYGIISAMALTSNFLFVIITLSLDRSIYRCFFDYKTEEGRKTFLGTIVISLFGISTIFVIFIFLFNKYVSLIFKSISFYPFYFLAITTTYIHIFLTVLTIYYQVTEQSKKFVFLTTSAFLVNTSLIIYFVAGLRKGAEGRLTAGLIGNLVFLPIVFFILKKHLIFKFKANILKNALAYSLPVIPLLISAWVLNLSDRIFIEKFYTLHEVGIYSMGYKLAGFIFILTAGFFTAYNPMFFRIANFEKEKKELLYKINKQFILIAMILHFIAFFFAEDIFRILIDQNFYESYKIFQLIIIGNLFNTVFSLLNVSFAQNKKMVTIMFIVIGGAIINVALNFFLVPKYGIYGAAYATVLSFALIGVIKYNFAKNYYFIPWAWKKILKYGTSIMIVIIIYHSIIVNNIINTFVIKTILPLSIIFIYIIDNKRLLVDFKKIRILELFKKRTKVNFDH